MVKAGKLLQEKTADGLPFKQASHTECPGNSGPFGTDYTVLRECFNHYTS